jgi:hypothetical protein
MFRTFSISCAIPPNQSGLAYRSGDFARGQCWTVRRAKAGNGHAYVLSGVSALMDWGPRESTEAAFKYFKPQEGTNNIWDESFLPTCYRSGTGTATDVEVATKIEDTFLRQSPVIAGIGCGRCQRD